MHSLLPVPRPGFLLLSRVADGDAADGDNVLWYTKKLFDAEDLLFPGMDAEPADAQPQGVGGDENVFHGGA